MAEVERAEGCGYDGPEPCDLVCGDCEFFVGDDVDDADFDDIEGEDDELEDSEEEDFDDDDEDFDDEDDPDVDLDE